MSGLDQENAYFYELNKELIDNLHKQFCANNGATAEDQKTLTQERKAVCDYLDKILVIDEKWIATL